MQTNQTNDNNKQNDLPDYKPVTPPISTDDTENSEAEAASESGSVQPVFNSTEQPQKIYDPEILGTNDVTESLNGENTVVNFDPENDPRMQEQPEK